MKNKIVKALDWYIGSEYHVLDRGITEIHWENYNGHEISLGVSYETNEKGNKVYIFNFFCDDDEYINVYGEFEKITSYVYQYLADCWYDALRSLIQLTLTALDA